LFHKTKLCKFHLMSSCTKGASCTYAHGSTEKQPLPDFHCTKLCPDMVDFGVCNKQMCMHAHDIGELRRRKPSDVLPQHLEECLAGSNAPRSLAVPPSQVKCTPRRGSLDVEWGRTTMPVPRLTKEALTRQLSTSTATSDVQEQSFSSESTECSWSTSSQTLAELTVPTANDGMRMALHFKTRMCKFHARGACTKGTACTFAHDAIELRPSPKHLFEGTSGAPITLPYEEGSRELLATVAESKYYLTVKNSFFTVETEKEADVTRRRSKSSTARTC